MPQLLLIMVLGMAGASQQSLVQDELRAQGLRPQEDLRAGWGEAGNHPGNSWNSPDAWRKEQEATGKREEEPEERSAEGRSLECFWVKDSGSRPFLMALFLSCSFCLSANSLNS